MSSKSNHATVHGDSNKGTQIAQSYGPISIVQHPAHEQRSGAAEEDACLQLFRLSREGEGGSYEWYKNRIDDRVPGTCQWFLDHPNYVLWRQSSSGPLLVSADPGCGKSVLAKYLIEHELSETVCYFFFKDQDQNSTRQALCALIHQLCVQRRSLLQYPVSKYKENGTKLLDNIDLLWTIFSTAVRDSDAGPVTIVLDALDECKLSDVKDLVIWLRKLLLSASEKDKGNIKILFTSRPYQNILSEFWDLAEDFPEVRIPGEEHSEQISQEVNYMIKHRVQQLARKFRLKSDLREYLEQRLLQMKHRTYLWVHLVFDHLNNGFKKTEKAITETIDTLPHSVNDAYEKILEKSTNKEGARITLSIVMASYRPFTLQEMNVAVHIISTPNAHFLEDLDLEDEDDFYYTIRDWCGLFVSIYDNHVYFFHQTAREFLLAGHQPDPSPADWKNWRSSIQLSNANAILTESCLRYLSFRDLPVRITRAECELYHQPDFIDHGPTGSPFFHYAVKYWLRHYHRATGQSEMPDNLVSLAAQLCNPQNPNRQVWLRALHPESARIDLFGVEDASNWSTFRFACHYSLEDVALRLSLNEDFDCVDEDGQTPLFYAVDKNLISVVALLLEKGANFHRRDRRGESALLAFRGTRPEIFKMFIERGADVDAVDFFGSPLLHLVVRGIERSGSTQTLIDLIAANVNVNARDPEKVTALHIAASYGGVEAMPILLDVDASLLNARDSRKRTPLHLAAYFGNHSATRFLIEHGAELDARNCSGRTPLCIAIMAERNEVCKLFLQAGANINLRLNKGQSILEIAAEAGNRTLVNLLMEHGAQVDHEMIERLERIGRYMHHVRTLLRECILPVVESTGQGTEDTEMDV